MKKINIRKRNTINTVFSVKRFQKQWLYLNVTDPFINPLIFNSFCYRKRVHGNKKFSRGNSKPRCESQITTRSVELWAIPIFIKIRFQQKSMTKFFKIKKKRYFGVTFTQRKSFVKTLSTTAVVSRLDIKPKIIPSLSASKNHSTNLLNSSNHLWDKPDLRVP